MSAILKQGDLSPLFLKGWRKLILSPAFFAYLVGLFLLVDSVVTIVLHPVDLANLNTIGIIEVAFLLVSLFLLALVPFIGYNRTLIYTMLVLIIAYPALIISHGLMDARMSVHYVPIAFLVQVGQQNKKLSYGAFITFIIILLGFFLSVILRPEIDIDVTSPELIIRIVMSMLLSGAAILIDQLWNKARSYYLTIEPELTAQIGRVTTIFSEIPTFGKSPDEVLDTFCKEINTFFDCPKSVIHLHRSEKKVSAIYDLDSNRFENLFESNNTHVREAISTRKTIVIGNTAQNRKITDKTFASKLTVPIATNEELIGVIEVFSHTVYNFNEAHIKLMEIVATLCTSKLMEFGNRALSYQALEFELESQQLQELDELKSYFIDNISKDIQAPLQMILSPTEELIQNSENEKVKQSLQLIRSNSQQLKEILGQLLELSELDVTSVQLDISSIDIGRLIMAWSENFKHTANQKAISFSVSGPTALEISGDQKKLTSIIHNLVSNALKYTPNGGKVHLDYGVKDELFYIDVHDSGHGIPEPYREKVFERFFRLGEADGKGTGIGLSIVHELTRAMEGHIQIADSHLGGAVFQFSYNLQYAEGTLPLNAQIQHQANELVQNSDKPIILVVDDHHDMRRFICSCLEQEFACLQASNGVEGLYMAEHAIPDLIITDLMMPEMTGEELCEKIRENEKLSHIPIVVLSAKSTQEDKITLYKTGADNYLVKPFEADELNAIVRTLIQSRNQLREKFKASFTKSTHLDAVYEHQESSFMEKLVELIEANMTNPDFNIVRLCELLKMGRNQVQRKVKALTDMTPVEFVRHIRLKKAALLLSEEKLTISEIAYDVGFNNLSYFTKQFKQMFGCLPSEFSSITTD